MRGLTSVIFNVIFTVVNDVKINNPGYFNIEVLAEKTETTRRTIRYYVQRGLIPKPEGGGRGHYYTDEHLERIKQIQRLSAQGVPLEVIKRLLSGSEETEVAKSEVVSHMLMKVEEPAPPINHKSQWIRINIGADVELTFRQGALSDEDQRAIQEFINRRIRD